MDNPGLFWHFSDMPDDRSSIVAAPSWNLYGEDRLFPDVLHVERIRDRAAGLGWVIAAHRHAYLHQFILVRSGRAAIMVDGNAMAAEAPFVLSIPKGVVHGFTFSEGTDGFVLTIPLAALPEVFDPAAAGARFFTRVAVVPVGATIMAAFDSLHAEHGARATGRPLMLRAMATEIACLLLRHMTDRADVASPPGDQRLLQFLDLVALHFRDPWTLDDYAARVGLSSRHLSRLCMAGTGATPGSLIDSTLMREACRRLAYTRATVAAIGFELGFDDPSYFSRAFRQHMGLSPRAYRRNLEADEPKLTPVQVPRMPKPRRRGG